MWGLPNVHECGQGHDKTARWTLRNTEELTTQGILRSQQQRCCVSYSCSWIAEQRVQFPLFQNPTNQRSVVPILTWTEMYRASQNKDPMKYNVGHHDWEILTNHSKSNTENSSYNGLWDGCKNSTKFSCTEEMMSQSIISLLGNISVFPSGKKISISNSACQTHSPKIEKKIMKTAEIWITLRLPTRVSPISPTFSLQNQQI